MSFDGLGVLFILRLDMLAHASKLCIETHFEKKHGGALLDHFRQAQRKPMAMDHVNRCLCLILLDLIVENPFGGTIPNLEVIYL